MLRPAFQASSMTNAKLLNSKWISTSWNRWPQNQEIVRQEDSISQDGCLKPDLHAFSAKFDGDAQRITDGSDFRLYFAVIQRVAVNEKYMRQIAF